MATDFYEFRGKAYWARLQRPDKDFNQWNVKLYLDDASYNLFMKLKETDENGVQGIMNEVRKEEDGYSVIFRRPTVRNFGRGEQVLAPPLIFNNKGIPISDEVGNGSDITVRVECYSYKVPFKKGPDGKGVRGRAIRMVAVTVNELIPFSRGDMSEEDIKYADAIPPPKTKALIPRGYF